MVKSIFGTVLPAMLAGSFFAGAASAQQVADDRIVVTGQRITSETLGGFISRVAGENDQGKLVRWNSAVCPRVSGLRDELNDYIGQTAISVAQAIGTQARGERCEPNLIVLFVSGIDDFLAQLERRNPRYFASLSQPERRALLASGNPVRAWNVTEMRGADGRPLETTPGQSDTLTGVTPTRIGVSASEELANRIIVIDLDRVAGKSIQQLSGFVAMLALADADIRSPISPQATILNLFQDSVAAVDDLTDIDVAYLRALYASASQRNGAGQSAEIADLMTQMLNDTVNN